MSYQTRLENQSSTDRVVTLTGLEAVRKRPGMYVGNTADGSGLRHMIYEVLDNAIDAVSTGEGSSILVTLHPDDSVSVSDNGRGMPIDIEMNDGHEPKRSRAEIVLCELYAGRPFGSWCGKPSGLHGVGVSVVNALSEWLQLTVQRDEKTYGMEFRRGEPLRRNAETIDGIAVAPLPVLGTAAGRRTEIRFLADKEIFGMVEFDADRLAERFCELSYLNNGIEIRLVDLRSESKTWVFAHDIRVFVTDGRPLHPHVFHVRDVVRAEGQDGSDTQYIQVEAALQWHQESTAQIRCYTNGVRQPDGGTHLQALRTAVLQAVVKYRGQEGARMRGKTYYTRDSVCRGLNGVLSIRMNEPRYGGATKNRLCSPEVKIAVDTAVTAALDRFFDQNPEDARIICNKIMVHSQPKVLHRLVTH